MNDFASAIWICACIFFIEIIVTPHVLLCRDYTLKKIWKNLNRGGALLHVFAIFPTDYQQFTLRVPPPLKPFFP